jgi:hypothetical protein
MTTIRRTATRSEVTAAFDAIVGEECWAIIGGPGTGSAILLDLGAKLPRDQPLKNDKLTAEERQFEAPYSINTRCSWRVEQAGRVVGSWVALPEEGWWVRSGLDRIKNRRLTAYELGSPVPDLRLQFDDVVLALFADTLSESASNPAFWLSTPDEVFVVFANGELQRERVEL